MHTWTKGMDCTRAGFALWAMEAASASIHLGDAGLREEYTQIDIDGFMARAMGATP